MSDLHIEEYDLSEPMRCWSCDTLATETVYAWADEQGREESPHYCSRECAEQDMRHGTDDSHDRL